jgi:hypothetical protein
VDPDSDLHIQLYFGDAVLFERKSVVFGLQVFDCYVSGWIYTVSCCALCLMLWLIDAVIRFFTCRIFTLVGACRFDWRGSGCLHN